MSIRHPESLWSVGEVPISLTGDYHTVAVEVTTGSNIKKVLTLSESEASLLCASLSDALSTRPEEGRKERFHASIRAGRHGA